MKTTLLTRLARLESHHADRGRSVAQDILLDLIDVPPEEAARRIAEAEAQKVPGAWLIIVRGSTVAPSNPEDL